MPNFIVSMLRPGKSLRFYPLYKLTSYSVTLFMYSGRSHKVLELETMHCKLHDNLKCFPIPLFLQFMEAMQVGQFYGCCASSRALRNTKLGDSLIL